MSLRRLLSFALAALFGTTLALGALTGPAAQAEVPGALRQAPDGTLRQTQGAISLPAQDDAPLAAATLTPTPTRTATRTPTATPTPNPTPPGTPVRLVFVHHSVGENWLNDGDGELGIALRDSNYYVSDTSYGWGPDAIGDYTDIGHWWNWFRSANRNTYLAALYPWSGQYASYSRLPINPGGENKIIMFKSCFPNSYISGSPTDPPAGDNNPLRGQDASSEYMTVSNVKGIYNDILAYFATRPDKLFVLIVSPPLVQNATDAAHAANARAVANWLVRDWLANYPYANVAVFDFYNVLTSNGGDRNINDLGWPGGNHHRWWNGAVQHSQTVNNNYSAYGYDDWDSHPTTAGSRKATGEFVALLNIFYNRWRASQGTPTPTATATATPTRTPTPTATPIPLAVRDVRASPNPFNPAAGTTISYTLSKAANATLVVLDGEIGSVRVIGPVARPGGPGSFFWDGRNQAGQVVSSGLYVNLVVASAGAETAYSYTLATADSGVAPVITNMVANPPVIIPPGGTTVSYQVSKGSVQVLLVLNQSGVEVRRIIAGYKKGGPVSIFWDGRNQAGSYVPDGDYIQVPVAVDLLGRVGFNFTVVRVGTGPTSLSTSEARKVASAWVEAHRNELAGLVRATLEARLRMRAAIEMPS